MLCKFPNKKGIIRNELNLKREKLLSEFGGNMNWIPTSVEHTKDIHALLEFKSLLIDLFVQTDPIHFLILDYLKTTTNYGVQFKFECKRCEIINPNFLRTYEFQASVNKLISPTDSCLLFVFQALPFLEKKQIQQCIFKIYWLHQRLV